MSVVQMNNSSNEQQFKRTIVQTAVVQMRIHPIGCSLIDRLLVIQRRLFYIVIQRRLFYIEIKNAALGLTKPKRIKPNQNIRILQRNLTSQLIQWQKKQTAYCQYLKSVCKRKLYFHLTLDKEKMKLVLKYQNVTFHYPFNHTPLEKLFNAFWAKFRGCKLIVPFNNYS